jgi:UPF0755 protein
MLSKNRKKLYVLLLSLTVVLIGIGTFAWRILKLPALNNQEELLIEIDDQATVNTLSELLEKKHGLSQVYVFKKLSARMNLQKFMKNGRYHIPAKATLIDVIKIFREGKLKTVNLVIKPLSQLEQLAKKCSNSLEADSIEYMNVFRNDSLLRTYGFDTNTVQALVLPDLYNVYWHINGEELLNRLKKEYDVFWNGERTQKLQRTGLTKIEVSILASIVSKETNKIEEMPMIAGMYLNRIKTDMLLQADPTVKFALKQPRLRRILRGHLTVESPYNTYLYKGLPPGPICIPGKESIDAVLNFVEHNYLFMCAKEDFSGFHNFAETYDKHLANARLYQKALNERNIK